MKLSSIHHIAIIVSDIEKAREFYVQKLGFEVIRENYRAERGDWKLDLRVDEHTELEIFAEKNSPQRVNRPEGLWVAASGISSRKRRRNGQRTEIAGNRVRTSSI